MSIVSLKTLLLVVAFLVSIAETDERIRVKTQSAGTVIGTTVTLKDGVTKMHQFHNIRYAQAPVGKLRFRPPVRNTVETPETEVDATDSTPVKCIQWNTGEGTEDCLVLSVRTGDVSATKPVIVWIHGGAMAYHYNGVQGYSFDAEVTNEVDAVTVNINYRLGFLGFSSVRELWDEKEGVYANNGIRDMIAALDWIQDNIAAFGGDPNSVTIIGNSGGATAVLGLLCSPLANNKFHAAIASSPAPEVRFTHEDGDKFQRDAVSLVGCTQETAEERKQCLLSLPATAFSMPHIKYFAAGFGYFKFPLSMGQVADVNGLLIQDPVVVTVTPRTLHTAKFTPRSVLPIIVSNVAQEMIYSEFTGSSFAAWLANPPFTSMEDLKAKLGPQFANLVTADAPNKRKKWLERQANKKMRKALAIYPTKNPVTLWSLLTTDMRSTCPTNSAAEAMSTATNRDVYRLYVTQQSSIGTPTYHGYDMDVLFGFTAKWIEIEMQEMDKKFHNHYVEMVKRFVREGRVEEGWGRFPQKSMVFENSDKISRVGKRKPQQKECQRLARLDLVKYGWQNK